MTEKLSGDALQLREAASDLIKAAEMIEHNAKIFQGAWKKGSKAWSGEFIERMVREAIDPLRAAPPSSDARAVDNAVSNALDELAKAFGNDWTPAQGEAMDRVRDIVLAFVRNDTETIGPAASAERHMGSDGLAPVAQQPDANAGSTPAGSALSETVPLENQVILHPDMLQAIIHKAIAEDRALPERRVFELKAAQLDEAVPRMTAAALEGRAIEEGCRLEQELAALLRADGGSAKADSDPLFVAVNAVHEKDERQRMHDQGVRDGLHPPVPPKHKPVA